MVELEQSKGLAGNQVSADSKQTGITRLHKLWMVVALPLLIISSYRLISNNAGSCTTCPTPEQVAYFTRQADAAREFREADRRLAALLDQVQQSPGPLYAERWRLRDILDRMNFAAGDMIDPESPSGTEEHQRVTARYSEGQVEANEMLWQAVLAEDAEQIYRANARRREADRLLGEIIAIRAGFCE